MIHRSRLLLYSVVILVVFGVALFIYFKGGSDRAVLIGAAIAGMFGFFYFLEQQRLAETQLFYSLFTDFNERYDKLNDRLAIIAYNSNSTLSESDRALIIDYFNICAEEYLFFKMGYINDDVWKSWCNGMLWYFGREPFGALWSEEIKGNSYYGLILDIIRRGARNTRANSRGSVK